MHLIRQDTRGGIFAQTDVATAGQILRDASELSAAWADFMSKHSTSAKFVAYKVRAMLSHLRIKQAQFAKLKGIDKED
eukprot:3206705-Pyramimonas_sp.AAC.2